MSWISTRVGRSLPQYTLHGGVGDRPATATRDPAGVGMTVEMIKNDFTQIGKSDDRSTDFNQEEAA